MLNLESPLSTISRNCKNDNIAVGGKSLVRIYKLSENNDFKLQKILKIARTNSKVGTTDLAWNNHLDNILASTTLLNSNVLVWDINEINLNRLNKKLGSHTQLINRVNWSNTNPDLLASCSQDGYLNIWNRNHESDQPVISMHHKEKIRDCQFSPFYENYILASYMSGAVKLWDTRNYKSHVQEFIQHETDVLSIDWHPDLKDVFCTGSMDKNLYIWDTKKSTPIHSYKTSHGISRVKWWKKNPQYIISSYQTNNFYASMWNINIDNMPEYLYKGHKDVVTGFCWDMSETRLITCSKDNMLIVNNFSDGYRCIDNVCTNITKFGDGDKIYHYNDNKPLKTDFNLVNYSRLESSNNINKKHYKIKISDPSSEILINPKIKLNHYYTLERKEIKNIFENYNYILNSSLFMGIDYVDINKEETLSGKIRRMVNNNLKYARDKIKNINHVSVWSQLKFLCETESFNSINKGNIVGTNINTNMTFSSKSFTQNDNSNLMMEIFKNNIIEIIHFLIDYHADIWLATIIIYLFQNIFNFNKAKNLLVTKECFENLRRYKLYNISSKLMKFGIYEEMKSNKQNVLMIMSCKKCNTSYDPTINDVSCSNCKIKIKCTICLLPVLGTYTWCSGCSHGGHIDHMHNWFKERKLCPSGCGHKCN